MEFFDYTRVTSSVIILALTAGAGALLFFVLATLVNFVLNSKEWGKEILDPYLGGGLIETAVLGKGEVHQVETSKGTVFYAEAYPNSVIPLVYAYMDSFGSLYYDSDKSAEQIRYHIEGTPRLPVPKELQSRVKSYLESRAGTVRTWVKLIIPAAIVIDVCLFAFTKAPIATLSIVGTVTTLGCTRWVSGKLASNVKQTMKNTSDIKDLKGDSNE